MKFYGTPKLYVKISNKNLIRLTGLKGFTFDNDGVYETDNQTLINTLKMQFKYEDDSLPSEEKTEALEAKIEGVDEEEKPKTKRGRK